MTEMKKMGYFLYSRKLKKKFAVAKERQLKNDGFKTFKKRYGKTWNVYRSIDN